MSVIWALNKERCCERTAVSHRLLLDS